MIDWTKPIETLDGRKCQYRGTINSDHLLVVGDCAGELLEVVTEAGESKTGLCGGVRNVPGKHERWTVFEGDPINGDWQTKEISDRAENMGRTACILVEWQDGEGLT